MPRLQAIVRMPLVVPMGVPVSSPRRVSVAGVNGWYLANCCNPVGMVAVGTNALLRKGSSVRTIGVLLAVSTLFAARPSAVDSLTRARVNKASTPIAASHSVGVALGRNPSGAEPVDDAGGHVHRDDDCGALNCGGNGQDQDAGADVVEIARPSAEAARELSAEAGPELAAEDVDELQQKS
jgi:hypothetical protein